MGKGKEELLKRTFEGGHRGTGRRPAPTTVMFGAYWKYLCLLAISAPHQMSGP